MHTSSSSAQGEYSSTSRHSQHSSYGSGRMEPSVSMTDDLEPSDEWKQRLKTKIEDERAAMEADAKRQLEEDVRSVPHQRETILREHQKALQNIRVLAEDKFRTQLEQERQDRKWAAQMISMDGNVIPDAVRAEQEALFARIKQESGGDASQGGRQEQPPGSAGISPPTRSNSRTQTLPVLPDRPPLPPNMAPPPTSSPSKPEVWVPKSSASSASSSRPPQSQRKDPPPSNREWPDRGTHPAGGFPRPNSEHDAPALSKSPPPSSARLSPWAGEGVGPRGGFGGGGISPRPIDRPPTTSPFADHPPYQSHQPPPPSMASSPPGTSPSPRVWQPAISPEEEMTSPSSTTPSFASTLGFGQGGPGSTTSTSSSTSKPFSSIGRRGSSASIRSVASTASTRSMASVTSMTSMRSSVSGKGRMGMDDTILERAETDSDGGYDEDDDHEYGQRRGVEPEGTEEEMRHRIAETTRRIQEEQQRQKGVEMAWQRPMGGSGEAGMDDGGSRPKRGKTLSSIPVLPLGPSSSSESKKSGKAKSKSKSKPLSASATVPQYDAGYMRSGKEWDGSREWEREDAGQSGRMRGAMNPNAPKPPSSSTRPISIQPTLIDDEFNYPYSQSHSPYPPLSSSASSSKRSKSISRKASSNFTEPPAIYGPDDVPSVRSGRRFSNEQHSQMYGAGDDVDGPPTSFEHAGHRRNMSGPSVLPTPPPSTSNTRSNSLRYPPPNRAFSGSSPYTQEPEGYEDSPAGVMDGYERNRLSRDAGKEMDEEWGPENPRRRLSSSSASSATKWHNPASTRRTPGKPVPQHLSFDRDDEESANMSYRERMAPPYPNDGSQSAYPPTWNPPRSGRPTGDGDPSPQKPPQPPYSADPYGRQGYSSVGKRSQQSLREQEERGEPIRPQRTTSMRSNGKSAPSHIPPDWYGPRQPADAPPSRRPSQRAWGQPPPGPPQYRRPGDSDDDHNGEDEEESSGEAGEDYRRRPDFGDHDGGELEGLQYPQSQGSLGTDGRWGTGHGPAGPGGIRGRHQHRYRQSTQRKQQRVRIEGDEIQQTESEESQEEEEDSEEDSEEGDYGEGARHRRNAGEESDFIPPARSMGRATPFRPVQYDGPAPSLMSRAPSGGPGHPKRPGDGWGGAPQPQYRGAESQRKQKKKQKKRWLEHEAGEWEDRELIDQREGEERAEAERKERERAEAERVEKERAEQERMERERAELERREKELQEKEREEREKREKEEREKREYMEKREREEREREEKEECERKEREQREKEWERERQSKRELEKKREAERERKRAREREREQRDREAKERDQRLREEEIEKKLDDLKCYAAEAEAKMRHAQDLADKNRLADERAEEYERKNEEATKLAKDASEKWKEADRRYNEARLLVQMAKQRAAEAKKKELEIMERERELRDREAQLRRFEEELKRKEEERVFEEQKRIVEEERRRLEEEAKEEQSELEQNHLEKTRLEGIVAEQARQLEELKREREEEKAKNASDDSYGLAEIFGLEDIPEEDPATLTLEDEGNSGKKPKAKKEKKGKGKRAREEKERRDGLEEQERLAREQRVREEQEEMQRLEDVQRAREEQDGREREEQERRSAQEERDKRKKQRKEKRKSKEQRPQFQMQENQPLLTPEELEQREQQALEAEEMRKQEEQEAQRFERERIQREQQEEEERQAKERERVARQKEVERMKRAREAMEAEERFRREQETKHREEEERLEKKRQEDEERRKEEESRGAQQAGYRRMDEELRRKRQDSGGGIDSAWTSFNSGSSSFTGASRSPPPSRNFTTPFPDRSPPAWASWGTAPTPPTPTSAWSTNMAGNTPTAGFPPRPSTTSPNKPRSGSMGSSIPDHQEWERKQAEFVRQQEEKFKKEQERAQRAAWTSREAGRIPTKEELVKLFENNERVWSGLPSMAALRWADFPWPMVKRPSNPEDITTTAIEGYVLSQFYPDKSKADKDRVKEYIRRWHPDRFETKLLNKVVEEERERVREGAGSVARSLNDILAKMNDS